MTKINLEKFRANPKYYLFGYQQFDVASMQASFIKSVYEQCCFTFPQSTTLFSCGEDHFIRANDCFLQLNIIPLDTVPSDYGGYNGIVDWLFSRSIGRPNPNHLLPFEGVALIIYLTEWCVASIATYSEYFRQTFYEGRAVTPCERRSINDLPLGHPFIQLQFKVSSPQFTSRLVTNQQVRNVFQELKRYNAIPDNLQIYSQQPTEQGLEIY